MGVKCGGPVVLVDAEGHSCGSEAAVFDEWQGRPAFRRAPITAKHLRRQDSHWPLSEAPRGRGRGKGKGKGPHSGVLFPTFHFFAAGALQHVPR
jgi:hypothetical protein